MTKSRPVLVIFSILAALQFLAGGAALSDVVGPEAFGLFVLGVGAIQAGFAVYTQSQVVPVQDVASYVDTNGNAVAGPASAPTNGVLVEVTEVV